MKTFITLLFAIGSTLFIQAQNDPECLDKIADIDSLVTAGNFPDAYKPWSEIRQKCGASSNDLYVAGETILQRRVEMASADDKEAAVRDLLALYDDQNKFFPANSKGNALKKALALTAINSESPDEIFKLLDKAFATTPELFTDAKGLYTYFDLYYKRHLDIGNSISFDDLLAKQDAIEAHLIRIKQDATPLERKSYDRVSKNINRQMAGISTCEKVVAYYEKAFDANKDNADWLERTASRLRDMNCVSGTLFGKITSASHSVRPTALSAYNAGSAALQSGDREQAAKYFNQSAALNPNPREKANLYYLIASNVYSGTDKAKAKDFAKKAITADPNMGKAYMFLAQLYANSGGECGKTEFEQKAIYWLAAEMARKAGEVDPNLKRSGSDKTAENYAKKGPTPAEIREQKKLGREIEFKCWINESVKVPKS